MYGAILGDIIGSPFEFDRGKQTKDFELFSKGCTFTDRTLDEIRPYFCMNETCQKTVPEAITAFLEAKDFEDAIRNAVSLGGDTDTLGAITGSIAEAYFGIPKNLIDECNKRIDINIREVVDRFELTVKRKNNNLFRKFINRKSK